MHYMDSRTLRDKLSKLGPSIMDTEPIAMEELVNRWRRYNSKNVCVVLLNHQDAISGIGNYLKATVLYECGVHPMANIKNLSDETLYQLYTSAREWGQKAYRAGGASLYTYTGMNGDRTDFKMDLPTYDRLRDPAGRQVLKMDTPDDRTTHWVAEVQTKGAPERPKVIVKMRPAT